jgi:hypothetical protein
MVNQVTSCCSTIAQRANGYSPSNQSVVRTDDHRQDESRDGKILERPSSCLLFQMFGVETDSFLPNQQSDGGDLARQS